MLKSLVKITLRKRADATHHYLQLTRFYGVTIFVNAVQILHLSLFKLFKLGSVDVLFTFFPVWNFWAVLQFPLSSSCSTGIPIR